MMISDSAVYEIDILRWLFDQEIDLLGRLPPASEGPVPAGPIVMVEAR